MLKIKNITKLSAIKLLTLLLIFSFTFHIPSANAETYPELCQVLTRTFGIGDQGPDVKRLQVVLGQEGIAYIGATGYFGPVTRNAVKIFQLRNGISQTGAVGPITLRRMQTLWCSGYTGGTTGGNTGIPTNTGGVIQPLEVNLSPVSSLNYNVLLGWTSTGATGCNLNGEQVPPIGQKSFYLTNETNFTISCNGNTGTVSKTITIRPNDTSANLPNVSVTINPVSALVNSYATIFWTSTKTTSCTFNGQTVPTSGSQQVLVSALNTAYRVSCVSPTGQTVSSTVYSSGTTPVNTTPVATANIYLTNPTQTSGAANTLVWSSTNASSCIVTGSGTNYYGTNGSQTVYPTTNTIYVITCTGLNGQSVSSQVIAGVTTSTNITADMNTDLQTYRGQTGTTLTVYCPANLGQSQVWGTDTYSDDSSICSAAVHAGKLNYSTGGTVTVQIAGPQSTFTSTSRNGVTSLSYGYWPGSFIFTGTTGGTTPSVSITPTYTSVAPGVATSISVTGTSVNSCSINGGTYTNVNIPMVQTQQYPNYTSTGNFTVSPTTNTTYTISCIGTNGQTVTAQSVFAIGGTTAGSVSINVSTVGTGNGTIVTWSNAQSNAQGVILDLINSSGTVVGTLTKTTNGGSIISSTGTYNWTVPKAITDIRNDAISCQYVNGENLCGNIIYSGTYKIRATFFTPYNACFGFCQNVPGQQILGTVESSPFTINSTVTGGTGTGNITVNAYAGSQTTISLGGQFILSWNSTNASYCSVNFNGATVSSNQQANGSGTFYPTASGNYQVTCYNGTSQNTSSNVYVTVNGSSSTNVTVNVSANPTNVTYSGQPVTLTWNSTNANYCSITANNQTLISNQNSNGSYTVYPSQSTNYVVTCYNYSGQNNAAYVYVTLNGSGTGGAVSVNVYANTTTVASGQPVTLNWTSSNATYCNILANGTSVLNNQNVTGSYTVYPTQNTNYQVTCYNSANQSNSSYIYVNVNGSSSGNVSVTASANPTTTTSSGQTVTLSWTSTNANYCNISINGVTLASNQGTNGNYAIFPTSSGNYQVTCYNNYGQSGYAYVYITVSGSGSGSVNVSVSPASTTIASGQSTTLTFSVSNANYCYLNGGVYNSSYYYGNTLNGAINVNPTSATTYTATCYGANNYSMTASAVVNVGTASSTGSVTVTSNSNKVVGIAISVPNTSGTSGLIDWGDGNYNTVSYTTSGSTYTANATHTYSSAATYTIKILTGYGGTTLGQVSVGVN